MRRILLITALISIVISSSQVTWAAKSYVTDSIRIMLRTGPSTEHKIISRLASGTPVEILENQNNWSRIRFNSSEGTPKEGWVPTQYLMSRLPWERKAKNLEKENPTLRENMSSFKKQYETAAQKEEELTKQLTQTSRELDQVKTSYEDLKSGSKNYLKLKNDYSAVRSSLANMQEDVKRLSRENENLKISQNVAWFALGAAAIFFGWLIGFFTGRMQRKRKQAPYLYGR
jgi:SH3 domain protein